MDHGNPDQPGPPSPRGLRVPESARASDRQRELYRLLIESVTDYAIFALDATGHIASWNSGARRLKQYTASEIIGRHFSIFYPEEDIRARKPERELEIATREGRVEDEGWRIKKDGTRFWANVVITALRDGRGNLVGFGKVTRDLTERRAAEEQARRLAVEEASRSAADQVTRRLEETNDRLRDALHEAEHAREASRFLSAVSKVLSSSLDYDVTLRDLAQAIVPTFADWCAVDIVDNDDGIPRQVAITHANPDQARRAEELARKYPTDPHALTGVPNVIRTRKAELYPEITDAMLRAGAQDEKHLSITRALRLKSVMIVPLVGHDRTLGALTFITSDTGRRYSEADLDLALEIGRRAALAVDNALAHRAERAARADAEAANAAKMEFLAVMSHELRTPLNAIAGYAELIRMGLRGPVTQDQVEDLDRIVHSEQTLLGLINDVLNYAKLESGHTQFDLSDVPVSATLADVEAFIAPQLAAKELVLETHPCDTALRVRADPDKFRQILLNLLSNAIKFTNVGGTVDVRCAVAASAVDIIVRDTGVGIPTEKLDVIFDPFVQVDAKLTRAHQGTGLGLAIGRDLARAMGGDLMVASAVGKGSTFTLTLPSAPATA